MAKDISKNTVAVLLAIAIVLSVAVTWVALTSEPTVSNDMSSSAQGEAKVSLVVGNAPTLEPAIGSGKVTLKVNN